MIAEGRQTDQRASQQTHDSSADQAHQERAFECEIEKPIASEQAQKHADRERRGKKQKQHYFLVGVAYFREQKIAERPEANQQRCKRRREPHLQDHRKK